MLRIFMTLLIFSPLWANANPALILNLLYETDDLAFLHSKASDGNSKTTPIIAEDQARSLAADLSQSILRDDAIEPIYRAMRLTNVGILQTSLGIWQQAINPCVQRLRSSIKARVHSTPN